MVGDLVESDYMDGLNEAAPVLHECHLLLGFEFREFVAGLFGGGRVFAGCGRERCGRDAHLRGVGDDVEDITLNIHSPGGLITEGLLMYNALAMHQATIKARILGMCGSMATVIACAADEVEMPENAVFHIHEVQGGAWGSTSDLVRAADEAEFYQAMIAKIYATKTGMSTEKCIELMQEDLPMDGPRAKELGFVDNVTDPVALSACVRFPGANVPAEALAKLPAEARALFDTSKGASGKTPSTKSNSAPPIMTEAELKAAQAKLEADQKALADSQAAALKAQTDAETLKTEAEALKASADKKLKAAKKLRAEAEEKDGEDDEEETNEDDEDGDEDGKDEDGDGDGDGKASIAKVVKAAVKAAHATYLHLRTLINQ